MQRKVEYKNYHSITSRNYEEKLLQEIITENYELIYQSRGKCEIYRDTITGVSKKICAPNELHHRASYITQSVLLNDFRLFRSKYMNSYFLRSLTFFSVIFKAKISATK